MLRILTHHGDAHLVIRIAEPLQQIAPIVEIGLGSLEAQLFANERVKPIVDQAQRHLVNGKILVAFLDHRVVGNVAEQGNFLAFFAADRLFGAANEDVGLDADLAQLADGVLSRLGFQLSGSLQVGNQREVDVQAIRLADVEGELADRFQKRETFDVAHRTADFRDHHVDHMLPVVGQFVDYRFDFIGDVWNHLHRLAEKLAPAFLVDHRLIDLARRVVGIAGQHRIGKPLVVAQVEIGFTAVVQHVNFAVLIGAHRAGIDVDVGVELLHPHAQAPPLQEHADRSAGETLAERTDNAAGDEDVFGHSA